jgi:hypothetical protein
MSSALARVLGCSLALLAIVAPAAAAETRTAVGVDIVGDGPSPGRDITAVRAHWDSAGSLAVTAAFAGPISAADRAQLTANARAASGRTCLLESQDTYLLLSGYTGRPMTAASASARRDGSRSTPGACATTRAGR